MRKARHPRLAISNAAIDVVEGLDAFLPVGSRSLGIMSCHSVQFITRLDPSTLRKVMIGVGSWPSLLISAARVYFGLLVFLVFFVFINLILQLSLFCVSVSAHSLCQSDVRDPEAAQASESIRPRAASLTSSFWTLRVSYSQ